MLSAKSKLMVIQNLVNREGVQPMKWNRLLLQQLLQPSSMLTISLLKKTPSKYLFNSCCSRCFLQVCFLGPFSTRHLEPLYLFPEERKLATSIVLIGLIQFIVCDQATYLQSSSCYAHKRGHKQALLLILSRFCLHQ